jgi:hypothetical protein
MPPLTRVSSSTLRRVSDKKDATVSASTNGSKACISIFPFFWKLVQVGVHNVRCQPMAGWLQSLWRSFTARTTVRETRYGFTMLPSMRRYPLCIIRKWFSRV